MLSNFLIINYVKLFLKNTFTFYAFPKIKKTLYFRILIHFSNTTQMNKTMLSLLTGFLCAIDTKIKHLCMQAIICSAMRYCVAPRIQYAIMLKFSQQLLATVKCTTGPRWAGKDWHRESIDFQNPTAYSYNKNVQTCPPSGPNVISTGVTLPVCAPAAENLGGNYVWTSWWKCLNVFVFFFLSKTKFKFYCHNNE